MTTADRRAASPTDKHPAAASVRAKGASSQILESHKLFGDTQEVLIRHGAETYRLRQTRAGKLILTK